MEDIKLPKDIAIKFKTIMYCSGCTMMCLETVVLYSKSIELFKMDKYFLQAGIEVSSEYLDDIDFDTLTSVEEIGILLQHEEDIPKVQKFIEKNYQQIRRVYLLGNKQVIKDNFNLGRRGIMGSQGKIFYVDAKFKGFTIQGIVDDKYKQDVANKIVEIRGSVKPTWKVNFPLVSSTFLEDNSSETSESGSCNSSECSSYDSPDCSSDENFDKFS